MPRDVAGISRTGYFQTVRDPATGLTFTPIGGTATQYRYRVQPGGQVITASSAADAFSLRYAAYEQGAATPPATEGLPSIASRHW